MSKIPTPVQIKADLFDTLPPAARKIRQEVFVDEQGFTEEFDDLDTRSRHILVSVNGKPVATGCVYPEEDGTWHIGRVAVRKEYRHQGLGTCVMRALETTARAAAARRIVLGAQDHAVPFYKKLGYTISSGSFLDQDALHWHMEKLL